MKWKVSWFATPTLLIKINDGYGYDYINSCFLLIIIMIVGRPEVKGFNLKGVKINDILHIT